MVYELFNVLLDFFDNIEVMGEMTNVACLNSFAPRQLMQDSVPFTVLHLFCSYCCFWFVNTILSDCFKLTIF